MPLSDPVSTANGTLSFGMVSLCDWVSVLICLCLSDLLHLGEFTITAHAAHRRPITHHRLLHVLLHFADHLINITEAHRFGEERIVCKRITTKASASKSIFHH